MRLIACIITSYFIAIRVFAAEKPDDFSKTVEKFWELGLGTPIEKFWREVPNIEPFNPLGGKDGENQDDIAKRLKENPHRRQLWVRKFPPDHFFSVASYYFNDGKLLAKSLGIYRTTNKHEIDIKGFVRWCISKRGNSFERKVVEDTHAGEVFYYVPQMLWQSDGNLVRLTFLPEMRFVDLKGNVEFLRLEILSKDVTDIETLPEKNVSEKVRTKLFYQVEKIVRDLK